MESVVKEAAKGGETAAGTIVEKLVGERHLVDDNGGEVVSTRVLCAGDSIGNLKLRRVFIHLLRLSFFGCHVELEISLVQYPASTNIRFLRTLDSDCIIT